MKKETMKCGKFGSFSWRRPNIPEGIDLLSRIYPSSISIDVDMANQITSRCVKYMGFLIGDIDLKIEKRKIETYEEMLEEYDLIKYLIDVAGEVIGCLDLAIKKKNG